MRKNIFYTGAIILWICITSIIMIIVSDLIQEQEHKDIVTTAYIFGGVFGLLTYHMLCNLKLEYKSSKTIFKEVDGLITTSEQLFIINTIKLLIDNPNCFSAKWFSTGKLEEYSIRSTNGEIMIEISTGQIFVPIKPKMTDIQLKQIKQLVKMIVDKDKKDIESELNDLAIFDSIKLNK